MIRLLLVDDHPVVREGLRALIARSRDLKVVAEAATGRQAIRQYFRCRPNVTLMDLRIPDTDGIEAISAIRKRDPQANIIVFTAFNREEEIYSALRAGARAYLLKNSSRDELLHCIRAVHEGENYVSPTAAARLAARISTEELTARESEVLRLLVSGKSNKEIGARLGIAEATVKVHVTRILQKLRVAGRAEAVSEALRRGLSHPGE